MSVIYFFQENTGFLETLYKYQTFIYLVVGFIIAIVLLRSGLLDRLASGWEKVSGMQDKERDIAEREIKQLLEQSKKDLLETEKQKVQILDLTREVDVRREINRQDSEIIRGLKLEIIAGEEAISRVRLQLRGINSE